MTTEFLWNFSRVTHIPIRILVHYGFLMKLRSAIASTSHLKMNSFVFWGEVLSWSFLFQDLLTFTIQNNRVLKAAKPGHSADRVSPVAWRCKMLLGIKYQIVLWAICFAILFAIFVKLYFMAICEAFIPSEEDMTGSAPALSKMSTTLSRPIMADTCRAVQPSSHWQRTWKWD